MVRREGKQPVAEAVTPKRGARAPARTEREGTVSIHRHSRSYRENLYVYPVLSRRARGVSIGINLNPDKVCTFNCIYCQVDRTVSPAVSTVDEVRLAKELREMLLEARVGALFERPEFRALPGELRKTRDITFSGDGEPTSYENFLGVVRDTLRIKRETGFPELKVVLLTNATLLDRAGVKEAMRLLDADHGEFWLKLDAGTEGRHREIARTTVPLSRVLDNILEASRVRPVVIQSLFMREHGRCPSPTEITTYCARLREIIEKGGKVKLIQVHTIARPPAESYVISLSADELDDVVELIRERLPRTIAVESFPGR